MTISLWNLCRGGPKNYGYQTKNGHVECKVRGFHLNSEGKTQLNYNVMRQNVLDEIQKPLQKPRQTQVIKTHQILRDPKTYQLFTFPDYKRYQLVYDKRVVDPISFRSYPYGYQWETDVASFSSEPEITWLEVHSKEYAKSCWWYCLPLLSSIPDWSRAVSWQPTAGQGQGLRSSAPIS